MEPKIDLHIHTWFSDGASSPTDIVKRAKEAGYDKIAITDHDGVDGLEEALEAGDQEGIHVIPGIELATETAPSFISWDMDLIGTTRIFRRFWRI